MCGCTHANPAECECGVNGPCQCSCHRNWQQGPRQPLDEAHAEIDRLRVLLEALTRAASVYLRNSTPGNAMKLHTALKQAEGESK